MSLFGISLDPISDLSSVLGNNNPISTTISGITSIPSEVSNSISDVTSGISSTVSGLVSGIGSLGSSLLNAATNLTNGASTDLSSLSSLIQYAPYILIVIAIAYVYSSIEK